MPYVNPKHRQELEEDVDSLLQCVFRNVKREDYAGVANYIICRILTYLFADEGGYRALNEASGVLFNAGLEFYRRITAPYEDEKILENGDVF